jgi:hypothetical protein
MAISASRFFEYLNQRELLQLERREIVSGAFEAIRRNLRRIMLAMRDSEDPVSMDVIDGIRPLLSEWLTVPTTFDQSIASELGGLLGPPDEVERRWGSEVRAAYEAALRAVENLVSTGSPMRDALKIVLQDISSRGLDFRVYCHRRAESHYVTLFPKREDNPIHEETFLHSIAEYRDAEPFDVLVKVGPLRAYGWGAVPDAIITAPRFHTLIQLVWSGSLDDENFGYDPVADARNNGSTQNQSPLKNTRFSQWTTSIHRIGDDTESSVTGVDDEPGDDLTFLQEIYRKREYRVATLIRIDERIGVFMAILYPPSSPVLSFDPDPTSSAPIGYRIPGETLRPGMFLIRPNVGVVDLGGTHAQHGTYSLVWKARLNDEYRANPDGLIARLRTAGLNLSYLGAAIEHWCKPPTTVIHAPQQRRHFEILVRVLGLEEPGTREVGCTRLQWWPRAWLEIAESRGEAIHMGFLGREVIDEQLFAILNRLIGSIQAIAADNEAFEIPMPSQGDIPGCFLFYPIVGIEHGFHAPEPELKVIHDLRTVEKWRD